MGGCFGGWGKEGDGVVCLPLGHLCPSLIAEEVLDLMPWFLTDKDEHAPCITKCVVPVLLIINLHTGA